MQRGSGKREKTAWRRLGKSEKIAVHPLAIKGPRHTMPRARRGCEGGGATVTTGRKGKTVNVRPDRRGGRVLHLLGLVMLPWGACEVLCSWWRSDVSPAMAVASLMAGVVLACLDRIDELAYRRHT